MKKGIFVNNWEVAALYDVISFVDEEGYFELSDDEKEVMQKLREHMVIVHEQWEESSEDFKNMYMNMSKEEREKWVESE